jgi:hypothetical protein
MPKLLMNCDQVFEVLTRAPFPTGAESDESVEHHLRCCHECRELAEALQPAVALLHEAIAPDEASGLPEYQGVLARLDHQIATAEAARTPLVVRRMAEPQRTVRRRLPLIKYARFTAALVLLLAVGSLVWSVVSTTKHGIAHRDRAPARLDQAGLVTLASLNLPAKCFPRELLPQTGAAQPATPAAINQDALRCCTECHNGASTGRAVLGSVATLHRSCVACHSL